MNILMPPKFCMSAVQPTYQPWKRLDHCGLLVNSITDKAQLFQTTRWSNKLVVQLRCWLAGNRSGEKHPPTAVFAGVNFSCYLWVITLLSQEKKNDIILKTCSAISLGCRCPQAATPKNDKPDRNHHHDVDSLPISLTKIKYEKPDITWI
jgi:hypothetical protein